MPLSAFQLEELGLAPYWKQRRTEPTQSAASFSESVEHTDPALLATEMLDWAALQARVEACRLCDLCKTRKQTVFGTGHQQANWLFVGEAPGAQEDLQGEPFVGQAGKLLNNMLHAIGLTRTYAQSKDSVTEENSLHASAPFNASPKKQPIYIANIIKCRPPGNRDPMPDEIAKCEPYLQRQLTLIRPKLIIALGRIAAQSLLKTKATISSLRGKVHHYENVPVIVTYHPAYLLRNLADKAKAWADLCFAMEVGQ